jgi:hypothetical protein
VPAQDLTDERGRERQHQAGRSVRRRCRTGGDADAESELRAHKDAPGHAALGARGKAVTRQRIATVAWPRQLGGGG